jgi:glycosyl transferase family 25
VVESTLFDGFDRIRIVNLESRADRRREMERQLARVGLSGDPRVEFFKAIRTANPGPFRRAGSHGAYLSHVHLLQQAGEAGESILILQDDCDFLFAEIEGYRLPPSWDIFYGGYTADDPQGLEASDIVGAHFMGFSPAAASLACEYLLQLYHFPDFPADPRAARGEGFDPAIRPPIDGALVWFRRAHPEMKTVFAMLSHQRSSRTDIGDRRWFDKLPGLRGLAEAARKSKRSLSPLRAAPTGEATSSSRG